MRRPCLTAALALVGWYLMTPPLVGDVSKPASLRVAKQTPLSQGIIDSSYDSAAECEQARLDKVGNARLIAEKAGVPDPSNDVLVQDAAQGQLTIRGSRENR